MSNIDDTQIIGDVLYSWLEGESTLTILPAVKDRLVAAGLSENIAVIRSSLIVDQAGRIWDGEGEAAIREMFAEA